MEEVAVGNRMYVSVEVRPADGKPLDLDEEGSLEVVGRLHIEVVVDTEYKEIVEGPGRLVGESHDSSILRAPNRMISVVL
ncbi:hypothetical protein [Streptosporangium sandarakinum]|uniref:hypothetical protein n=1 Tax=Streptosporangium sandarakinum TaxID=1260955 RepID=UPI003678895C